MMHVVKMLPPRSRHEPYLLQDCSVRLSFFFIIWSFKTYALWNMCMQNKAMRCFQSDIWLFIPVCSKPQLLQGVYGMGFNRPSKIQETALPMMLAEPWVYFALYMNVVESSSKELCLLRVTEIAHPSYYMTFKLY